MMIEIQNFFPSHLVCGVLLAVISAYYLLTKYKNKPARAAAPEPAGAWPVIGHILQFGPLDLWHRKLGDMADEIGPAFVIRLGMLRVLIINNWELAKECFTLNDKIFASRPGSITSKYMGYDGAMLGFAPDGPFMLELRKVAMQELFSNHRLRLLRHIRTSEIEIMIKGLNELYHRNFNNATGGASMLVHLDPWLDALTINVMLRSIAGKRYYDGGAAVEGEEAKRWKEAFGKVMLVFKMLLVSEMFPRLEMVDVMLGTTRAMKKAYEEMDLLLSGWLEEHRSKKDRGDHEQDFVDVLLNVGNNNPKLFSQYDVDSVVKATCLDILIAASDSTTLTLSWALSLLLNNRRVLKKVQEELDNQIGKDRHAEEEDIKNLPYLQAVVKETWRLYPPSPLSLPHEASKDCVVGGFHIPKGTSLMTNVWKIHRDPKVWEEDPLEFKPERFLSASHAHVDFRGLHFEFIPFGSGRRMCLGTNLAANIAHLTLARLLHEFELGAPDDAPLDMTESPEVSLKRASPLNVLIAPRLPSS